MNEMQILNFNENEVRTVSDEKGEMWWVATDVCKVLGLSNVSKSLERLDDDERSNFNLGRQGSVNTINEFGLYSLILSSRKKEAKAFKRWVTHEVLPTIRKTGGYVYDSEIEATAQALQDMKDDYIEYNRNFFLKMTGIKLN